MMKERFLRQTDHHKYQIGEWEYLDDNDSQSTETGQMICVFEELVFEESKIFCEFTLRVFQKEDDIFPNLDFRT